MQSTRKGFLDKAFCSACHEPGLVCAGTSMRKSDCFHDKLGHHWCAEHVVRGKMLNWAEAHKFPGIVFSGASGKRYAIGDVNGKPASNQVMWELAILCGLDDAIEALERYVQAAEFMSEVV